MNKTWSSGAIELLDHAEEHIKKNTAFDKRIAFISIDNAVEIITKTYLSLPKQFFGFDNPSRKELLDCNNSFTQYLLLLFKYADKKLIGIDPGDIEHYHRIRNTLYHDGTGLAVDQEYLNAYFTISKLLLKRLFRIDLQDKHAEASLEKLIINWNYIEENLTKIFDSNLVHTGTFKWEEAISKGILTQKIVEDITNLRIARNQIVHSKTIDNYNLKQTYEKSNIVLKELRNQIELNSKVLNNRNYFYEPEVSEIKGKLTLNSFYGPPSFGESPEIDMLEKVWILNLEKAINVYQKIQESEEVNFNVTQYNIDRVQLATFKHKIELKDFENKSISIVGTFWGAHTGHHFTPVLMDVINAKLNE